ncbi:hypothetical protein acdb102_47000 [Acidothermaceae bacterium B102]|nr:hypothetical protein acdb102_47000 [Acidothermaceae bacterium B102]
MRTVALGCGVRHRRGVTSHSFFISSRSVIDCAKQPDCDAQAGHGVYAPVGHPADRFNGADSQRIRGRTEWGHRADE